MNALIVIVSDFDDLVVQNDSGLVEQRNCCYCKNNKFMKIILAENWKFWIDLNLKSDGVSFWNFADFVNRKSNSTDRKRATFVITHPKAFDFTLGRTPITINQISVIALLKVSFHTISA